MNKLPIGCLVLALGALAAYFVALWWAVGVALDWANVHYGFGLAGTALIAVHILAFLAVQAILGSFARSTTSGVK